jgi:uncharacterized protein (DUF2252 family)
MMAESAFAFLRGTNHLYWDDLAGDPRLDAFGSSKTATFLQGDLHVANFGTFHDDEERVVYGLNDFDEGVVGDYQLDLWRGAVSIVLASAEQGFGASDQRTFVEGYARAYVHACEDFVGNHDEDGAVVTSDEAEGPLADLIEDAEKSSRQDMLEKWTAVEDGDRVLANDELAPIDTEVIDALSDALVAYGDTLSGGLVWDQDYFLLKDAALRLHAGLGSLGVPRYYLLVEGPTADLDDDVILDVKWTPAPTGLDHVEPDAFASDAERSIAAQKALLSDTDDHLGWLELDGELYTVRERSPHKDDLALDDLERKGDFESLAEQWGAILAAAHARADDDFDPELVPTSLEKQVTAEAKGRRSKLYAQVWNVASSYAAQVERDRRSFLPLLD